MLIKKDEFSSWVESSRAMTKESYMDTVLTGCDRFNVDVDLVQPLLSEPLIQKIKAEAIERRFFKTSSTSLGAFL